MFLPKKTKNFTKKDWDKIKKIQAYLETADAILLGAGAGLSTAAGLHYSGERFKRLMPDYIEKYGFTDMYSAAFYPHHSLEEFWAYFTKHIYYNRYHQEWNDCYEHLLALVEGREYFVLTTNADHGFIQGGFDKKRLWYMQGDYGLFQCSLPCQQKTYDNQAQIHAMVAEQKDFKIPTELIPLCPDCGRAMTTNLRKDETFVEDKGWQGGLQRYQDFLNRYQDKKILFFELGVGFNTPGIIKYPFWQMCHKNPLSRYVSLNLDNASCPEEIVGRSLCIQGDIREILGAFS